MTVRELARRLKYSKTTVADALRGKPWVGAKTREEIQRKSHLLGYRPNPVASAFLQQVRSRGSRRYRANLALMMPWVGRILGPTRKLFYQGATARAAELGYTLDGIDPSEYNSVRLTKILLARGILGVGIGLLSRSIGHMSLDWSKFATVAFAYSLTRPAVHRVTHDHVLGIRTAVRTCYRRGYSRIGLVLRHDSNARANGLWLAGFLETQQSHPSHQQVKPFLSTDVDYTPERFAKWIRREKPDVIIFHTAALIPSLPLLTGTGPGTIPAVLLDRHPDDPYAGIDQQYDRCGAQLIESLSSLILHNERGIPPRPTITMIPGLWVDHPSFPHR